MGVFYIFMNSLMHIFVFNKNFFDDQKKSKTTKIYHVVFFFT